MPKHKQFVHPKKQQKPKKNQEPETANEYLEAGVDFEEAGEKWRAGDQAKSLRFFSRAIEVYTQGLESHPNSFDLAYNKARIQFDIAQQPRLLDHDSLDAALESSRYALRIDDDSPDLLFNTAQLLTTVAERINGKNAHGDNASKLFREALDLFQRCLHVQESRFTEAQENAARLAHQPDDSDLPNPDTASIDASDSSESEIWATIVEPITQDTLLDTCLAQLETLTALCSLELSEGHAGLPSIEGYYRSILQPKLETYTSGPSRSHELALGKAKFTSAFSEAAYRNGAIDLATYERELTDAFSNPSLDLNNDPQGICDRADAETNFNSSIEASLDAFSSPPSREELSHLNASRWKHLTRALDGLTTASKIPNAQNLPAIHIRRGDCELLRLKLGESPADYDLARKSAGTLLNNAGIYYRAALAVSGKPARLRDGEEEQREAGVREGVVSGLKGDESRLRELVKEDREIVEGGLEEMRGEGLLGPEGWAKIGEVLG